MFCSLLRQFYLNPTRDHLDCGYITRRCVFKSGSFFPKLCRASQYLLYPADSQLLVRFARAFGSSWGYSSFFGKSQLRSFNFPRRCFIILCFFLPRLLGEDIAVPAERCTWTGTGGTLYIQHARCCSDMPGTFKHCSDLLYNTCTVAKIWGTLWVLP